jgi:hypothetical protein
MELSPSWEAANCAATQDGIMWKGVDEVNLSEGTDKNHEKF